MAIMPVPSSPTKFHPHLKKGQLATLFLEGTKFQDVKGAVVQFDGKTYTASNVIAVSGHPLRIEFTPTHDPIREDKSGKLRGSSDLTITLTYNDKPLNVPAAPVYYAD